MKTALVIMAAGIGSRFGGGIKQLAAVGPNGEIIMDYSIHDAIEAGFDKIVFIIRHDIEEAFKEAIGNRIEKTCADLGVEIAYVFCSYFFFRRKRYDHMIALPFTCLMKYIFRLLHPRYQAFARQLTY